MLAFRRSELNGRTAIQGFDDKLSGRIVTPREADRIVVLACTIRCRQVMRSISVRFG